MVSLYLMSFKIEIFMNKFWNNKIVYLQSLNKINSIHKLCINRFFILKKLIVLFCFVLFQSILFSQTNQSENEIVSDIIKEGDIVPVKIIKVDEKGRINFSIKEANKDFFKQMEFAGKE